MSPLLSMDGPLFKRRAHAWVAKLKSALCALFGARRLARPAPYWSPSDGAARLADPRHDLHLLSLGAGWAENLARESLGAGVCWIDSSGDPSAADRLEALGKKMLGPCRVARVNVGSSHRGPPIFGLTQGGSGALLEAVFAMIPPEDVFGPLFSLCSAAFMGSVQRAALDGRAPTFRELLADLETPRLREQAQDERLPPHVRAAARSYLASVGQDPRYHQVWKDALARPVALLVDALEGSLSCVPDAAVSWAGACGGGPASLIILEIPPQAPHARALSSFFASLARQASWAAPSGAEPAAKAAVVVNAGALPKGWGMPTQPRVSRARLAIEAPSPQAFARAFPDAAHAHDFAARAIWALSDAALACPQALAPSLGASCQARLPLVWSALEADALRAQALPGAGPRRRARL